MIMSSNLMRSKFIFSWGRIHEIKFFVTFHEVEIPNNWFDLMIMAFFMRSKLPNDAFFEFWSHEKSCYQEVKSIIRNLDLMKNDKKFNLMNSTSWKNEFRSHEIQPPDPGSPHTLWWYQKSFKINFNNFTF